MTDGHQDHSNQSSAELLTLMQSCKLKESVYKKFIKLGKLNCVCVCVCVCVRVCVKEEIVCKIDRKTQIKNVGGWI